MPFLNGTVTAQRLKLTGGKTRFGEEHVEKLSANSFQYASVGGVDGVFDGFAAGDHEEDAAFSCEKNLKGEFLHFAYRVTQNKYPPGRLKALYHQELAGRVEAGKKPTARQKREAKEAAQSAVEEEAKDGRYTHHTLIPVVWDGGTGEVWYGSASAAHVGRFAHAFGKAFGFPEADITPVSAQCCAPGRLDDAKVLRGEDVAFSFGQEPQWCPQGMDWIGNEFLLWVLWNAHLDRTELGGITFLPTKTLLLACPNGETGHETITHECPVRLPEVQRALQAGKLPRKSGLSLARWGEVYECVLQAEQWVVSGAKVPDGEDGGDPGVSEVNRLLRVRAMFQTLDDLFAAFLTERLTVQWDSALELINQWLGRDN